MNKIKILILVFTIVVITSCDNNRYPLYTIMYKYSKSKDDKYICNFDYYAPDMSSTWKSFEDSCSKYNIGDNAFKYKTK